MNVLWMGNAAFHVVLMWLCMYGVVLNQDSQDYGILRIRTMLWIVHGFPPTRE